MAALVPLALSAAGGTGLSAGAVGLASGGALFSAGTFAPALASLGTIASVASGASSIIGGIQQSRAAEAAAETNEAVAARNTEIAKRRTNAEVEQEKRQRRLRFGANLARTGASGVGQGAAMDILADNAAQEELNLMTIRNEGLLREQNFQTEAEIQKQRARNERGQRPLQILGGVSSVASNVLSRTSV